MQFRNDNDAYMVLIEPSSLGSTEWMLRTFEDEYDRKYSPAHVLKTGEGTVTDELDGAGRPVTHWERFEDIHHVTTLRSAATDHVPPDTLFLYEDQDLVIYRQLGTEDAWKMSLPDHRLVRYHYLPDRRVILVVDREEEGQTIRRYMMVPEKFEDQ